MPLLRELGENNPDDYRNYLRTDEKTSQVILNLVSPYITKKDTIIRTTSSIYKCRLCIKVIENK